MTVVGLLAACLYAAAVFVVPSAARADSSPALMPAGGQFFPVAPVKALDTRNGTGGVPVASLAAGATVSFPVEAVGQVPESGVSDVYVMINAISPQASGCLHDYNADGDDPGICTVSFQAGQNATNGDFVQVGAGGYVSVTNSSPGPADVAVTVMGYVQDENAVTAGQTYVPLRLAQIVDTRSGLGAPDAQIPAGGSLTVQVTGSGGVPSDAAGTAVYIGAANASAAGFVSAYPAGSPSSSLAVLSYGPARTIHGLYFGALSSSGQLTLVNQGSVAVDLMVGVQGYLVSPSASETGGSYQDVPEQRIADTRFGTGGVPAVPLASGGSITVTATGIAGIPATGVSSVAESVAALSPTASGYLSVYPAGTPDPLDPGVNFNSGDSQDNDMSAPVLTQVSGAGQETITNHSSGTIDIVVSARGYYAAASAPDAPGQVDAGLQSGTATVTWAAPDTDGGAAITSYALTLHNPDGSVNRVASAEPDATSWTATGLGAGTYSVSVAAVNSAGTSDAATATVNTVPPGWAAPNTENLTTDENITVDLATGNLSFDDGTATEETFAPDGSSTSVSSTPLASTDIGPDSGAYTDDGTFTDPVSDPAPDPAIGNFDCTRNSNSRIHAHTPWHDRGSKNSGVLDFLHESYTVSNARRLRGGNGPYMTFQDMICSTGGGEPKGNFHTYFSGTAVALRRQHPFLQGRHWGTRPSGHTVSSHTSFKLDIGVGNISASVGIQPGDGDYKGDIGNDGQFNGWKTSWANQFNRVNAFFISPHNFPFDGSTSFEGNNSEVMYEWAMGSTGTTQIKSFSKMKLFCAALSC